ncbi:hypothetical protein JTB14_004749 [Gonioctena quinquepunctata]|nr:hypothetical protein JTB14_004749 [Gonioctena quinquepunctata]
MRRVFEYGTEGMDLGNMVQKIFEESELLIETGDKLLDQVLLNQVTTFHEEVIRAQNTSECVQRFIERLIRAKDVGTRMCTKSAFGRNLS